MLNCQLDDVTELRLLNISDAKELFQLTEANREHLKEWLPWLDGVREVENSRAFIQSTISQYEKDNGFQLGIFHEGKLAGLVGFHGINWANKRTSIGYWLGQSFSGKGLMVRSCQVLVDHAFKKLKLNAIEIACATENVKSRAIPERLGFHLDGILRQREWLYDHYVDHAVYSMLSEEWKH